MSNPTEFNVLSLAVDPPPEDTPDSASADGALPLDEVLEQLETVIAETGGNPGRPFKPDAVALLAQLRAEDQAEYINVRDRIKRANRGTLIKELDKAVATSSPEEKGAVPHIEIARVVIADVGPENIIFATSFFWLWRGKGVWERTEDLMIRQLIHATAPEDQLTKGTVDGVLDLVRTETYIPEHEFDVLDPYVINTLSGELRYDMTTGSWSQEPHLREHWRTTQLPVHYEPQVHAPRFWHFLQEVFDPDEDRVNKARLVLECIGYTLLPTCRFERFIIFFIQIACANYRWPGIRPPSPATRRVILGYGGRWAKVSSASRRRSLARFGSSRTALRPLVLALSIFWRIARLTSGEKRLRP